MDRTRLQEIARSVDEEEERARNGYYDYIHKGYIDAEYIVLAPLPFFRKPVVVAALVGVLAFFVCVLLLIIFLYMS